MRRRTPCLEGIDDHSKRAQPAFRIRWTCNRASQSRHGIMWRVLRRSYVTSVPACSSLLGHIGASPRQVVLEVHLQRLQPEGRLQGRRRQRDRAHHGLLPRVQVQEQRRLRHAGALVLVDWLLHRLVSKRPGSGGRCDIKAGQAGWRQGSRNWRCFHVCHGGSLVSCCADDYVTSCQLAHLS